ncbi:MAG: bifunctional riboflavin kinase/FAD synthetase [Epsilonproteobacteria bacterium]|nr:bifunctional riboflavin kinase/FAD synthetase [Campylobacterota bacterium]NPA57303.1 bifunctional riboflavin kinase/FAD synthetase [Campylobacterota bacterium]
MSGSTILERIESAAIGGFDGVHRGHRELIERADGVVIIEKGGDLTPGRARCRYIDKPCLFYEMEEIRELTGEEFVALLQGDLPNLKRVVVGYDFLFGKDRRWTVEDLRHLFGGEVEVVDEVKVDGIPVHSRTIRELLRGGDVKRANRLLGRPYEIEGRQVRGLGIGSRELVPTINMEVDRYLLPKEGVYLTLTNGRPSLTFIGRRESLDGSFSIESHLLEPPSGEMGELRVAFIDYLRENRRFQTLRELKGQIERDIEEAKEFFYGL